MLSSEVGYALSSEDGNQLSSEDSNMKYSNYLDNNNSSAMLKILFQGANRETKFVTKHIIMEKTCDFNMNTIDSIIHPII